MDETRKQKKSFRKAAWLAVCKTKKRQRWHRALTHSANQPTASCHSLILPLTGAILCADMMRKKVPPNFCVVLVPPPSQAEETYKMRGGGGYPTSPRGGVVCRSLPVPSSRRSVGRPSAHTTTAHKCRTFRCCLLLMRSAKTTTNFNTQQQRNLAIS
ncbi:hypothetical protein niasHT_035663 [Heterodera trifolii]|uniref:Uncharacterized protein n=1 Tax=Heterodera trifolii TaxID=157864 RepID=A0ABD2IXD5_9BILA